MQVTPLGNISQMEVFDIMTANGLCKHCVGATVLIPAAHDLWRNCESFPTS
jgi:hypothetical protein